MSLEPIVLIKNTPVSQHKCRIPKRLLPTRQRLLSNTKSTREYQNRCDTMSTHQCRNDLRYVGRPSSEESRKKFPINSVGDPAQPVTSGLFRSGRERLLPAQKKPAPLSKTGNATMASFNKARKPIITVPLTQETSKNDEDLEMKQDFSNSSQLSNEMNLLFHNDQDSSTLRNDKLHQLKIVWQDKIVEFERLKHELNDKQNIMLKIYATLRNTKEELSVLGQDAKLPPKDNLRIMNVANMTPSQLLQMCTENGLKNDNADQELANSILTVNIKKLNDMPSPLINVCERILGSKKELIQWFENLQNQEKGCSKSTLSKIINDFNVENETLRNDLHITKQEFLKHINEFLRTYCDEALVFHKRTQDVSQELQKFQSQNTYLKKKLTSLEQQKSSNNKTRIEELSKELKDEKSRLLIIKQRLTRAEGQLKIRDERTMSLESALEQARVQTRNLERTIQQLNEQNRRVQKDFDDELNKLNNAMMKNTKHLEDIAKAREALQSEKEDLKIQLQELSNHYNESIKHLKADLNQNMTKLTSSEKEYADQVEQNQKLLMENESQCKELKVLSLRCENTAEQLKEAELTLNESIKYKHIYEQLKREFDKNNLETSKYKICLEELNTELNGLRQHLLRAHELEKALKLENQGKTEHIKELENNQALLIQKSQENKNKLETYEEQFVTLKSQITTLKEHFDDYENINELHDVVIQKNNQLNDLRCKNDELLKEVKNNREKLEHLKKAILEHEQVMTQRNAENKEGEAINLQLKEEIIEKNNKIVSLIDNMEFKNHQISQLEKIILAIEDSNRSFSAQKQKDQDKIKILEKKFTEYEKYIENKNRELPIENLDDLIKMLENEIDAPYDSRVISNEQKRRVGSHNELICGRDLSLPGQTMAPNICEIKSNIPYTYDVKEKGDSLARNQIQANDDTQNWFTDLSSNYEKKTSPSRTSNDFAQVNEMKSTTKKQKILYIIPNQAQEKNYKMFKFAGHKI